MNIDMLKHLATLLGSFLYVLKIHEHSHEKNISVYTGGIGLLDFQLVQDFFHQ